VGGLIGYDGAQAGSLSDTYWDTDTSGVTNLSQGPGNITNDPGITGLTTAQFQSGLPQGFGSEDLGRESEHHRWLSVSSDEPSIEVAVAPTGWNPTRSSRSTPSKPEWASAVSSPNVGEVPSEARRRGTWAREPGAESPLRFAPLRSANHLPHVGGGRRLPSTRVSTEFILPFLPSKAIQSADDCFTGNK